MSKFTSEKPTKPGLYYCSPKTPITEYSLTLKKIGYYHDILVDQYGLNVAENFNGYVWKKVDINELNEEQ